jgi:hypothetical protein
MQQLNLKMMGASVESFYSLIPIFSVSIFSARKENSNFNFSSLSDIIFSARHENLLLQMSKISGYTMHNFNIFNFFYFQIRIAEKIGIEL